MVRRAKEPDKGRWCFPGGSLELGETLAACAAREVAEEAGLELLGSPGPLRQDAGAWASSTAAHGEVAAGKAVASARPLLPRLPLSAPTPFTAVDVMRRDAEGRVQFHYAVIEVAAVCADAQAVPRPGDDADGAQWVRVSRLRGLPDLTSQCDEVAEAAAARFAVPLPQAH